MCIVLMALDHTRMYFGPKTLFLDPTDLATTTPLLFFTRWITHFVAPAFVFLAGTGAFLYGNRVGTKALSRFLLTRGLWLLVIEFTVVTFGWTFDPTFSALWVQVIWAIGFSMICLSAIIYLPRSAIFAIGIVLTCFHHVLDPIQTSGNSLISVIWNILHQHTVVKLAPHFALNITYPALPWIGIMCLGYLLGTLYQSDYDPRRRRRWLVGLGSLALLLFLVLRAVQIWAGTERIAYDSALYQLMDFVNMRKYPPSVFFSLNALGQTLLLLAWFDSVRNRVTEFLEVFGRVPFFFYVVHIYFVHALAFIGLAVAGWDLGEWVLTTESYTSQSLATHGFGLGVVFAVWVFVVVLLYPLCRWYGRYKAAHRDRWWLSYL
ncbi:hypothetical protein KJ815_10080 [bacterium]|nr:hypothetical protein [bacterium]